MSEQPLVAMHWSRLVSCRRAAGVLSSSGVFGKCEGSKWIGVSSVFASRISGRHRSKMTHMEKVVDIIKSNKIAIFSKTYCPFCKEVKRVFESLGEAPYALELDTCEDGPALQEAAYAMSGMKTVPIVYISQGLIGGATDTMNKLRAGYLSDILKVPKLDYDLIVIGGGSGGLAASKEASLLGAKVAVCDFVVPSPQGSTWGLGGTCVNVGCIPKKLMHKAAIIGEDMKDAPYYGWEIDGTVKHDWSKMVAEIQNYIKSLNFGYRKALKEKSVDYKNAFAKFIDKHTVQLTDKKGKTETITALYFLVACGGRPNYPEIPGALEYGITSDDLFSLKYHPGKCLIVGASYIALECAGFLNAIGIECTVMVRSILLRGFDQDMAEKVGNHMKEHGVKFIRPCVPTKIEQIKPGEPGLYKVTAEMTDTKEEVVGEYNTVLFAVGRVAGTQALNLEGAGVQYNTKGNRKIPVDEYECTTMKNIFAVGDVIDGKLELTPVAIQAGQYLARRLFGKAVIKMDYVNVPTTVFTPLEYGFVGLSEEQAEEQYGKENVEVFHSYFQPLEYALPKRDDNRCYGKLVCLKNEGNQVVGFHVLGPNAGEMTQGFALAVKLHAKYEDFANLVGIHPTSAEIFTTMSITKSSGQSVEKTSC